MVYYYLDAFLERDHLSDSQKTKISTKICKYLTVLSNCHCDLCTFMEFFMKVFHEISIFSTVTTTDFMLQPICYSK